MGKASSFEVGDYVCWVPQSGKLLASRQKGLMEAVFQIIDKEPITFGEVVDYWYYLKVVRGSGTFKIGATYGNQSLSSPLWVRTSFDHDDPNGVS